MRYSQEKVAGLEKQLEHVRRSPFAPAHALADAERNAASQSSALEEEVCSAFDSSGIAAIRSDCFALNLRNHFRNSDYVKSILYCTVQVFINIIETLH